MVALAVLLATTPGCQSAEPSHPATGDNPMRQTEASSATETETQRLLEGDDVRVAFPSVPNLDTTQKIRTDGKITLPLIGEVNAAGLTTSELQKILVDRYASELVSNQVTVSIAASSFPVYVTGAVMKPGEVRCDRPTTVWEAVMKAGGFDPLKARLDKVFIIRRGEGKIPVNLQRVMEGKDKDSILLKPSDTVQVPDKKLLL